MADSLPNKALDTTNEIVGALKGYPGLLVIVILNILVVGAFMYFVMNHEQANQNTMQQLMDKCITGKN